MATLEPEMTQHNSQDRLQIRKYKSKTLLFMLAATLKLIRLECYLPRLSGANKVSLFRADSLVRCLLQCALDSSVVAMDKTVVGLNEATRSCNVYPDKCWFAVLCRFWHQCSRTLINKAFFTPVWESFLLRRCVMSKTFYPTKSGHFLHIA
jgi:hypothetical protein